jgi:hypothetical protein
MKKICVLGVLSILLSSATGAAAGEYYIVQDTSTRQCSIVDIPPTTTQFVVLEKGQIEGCDRRQQGGDQQAPSISPITRCARWVWRRDSPCSIGRVTSFSVILLVLPLGSGPPRFQSRTPCNDNRQLDLAGFASVKLCARFPG